MKRWIWWRCDGGAGLSGEPPTSPWEMGLGLDPKTYRSRERGREWWVGL